VAESRHLTILHTVASALGRSLDADDVLKTALTALTEVTGHEISSLHLFSPDGTALLLRGERGLSEALREINRRLPVGQGIIGRVGASGEALVLDKVTESPLLLPAARSCVERDGIRGFVCVPIRAQGRLLGTLSLGRRAPEPFTRDEVRLLEATADQIGIALDHARLYGEMRQQLDELKRTQSQLLHAEKLAAIGELAAGVAHEINNPLTTIFGEAQLLLMSAAEGPLRDRLRVVAEQSERATRIVQNLLLFARRYPPQHSPCTPAEQMRRVLEVKAYQLQVDRIQVVTDFQPCPPIWADEHQIRQVLLNLVQNAHQAMKPRGRGQLTVRVRPDGDGVHIEVLDDGPGIPPENLSRLFNPFFTTRPPGEGTGLGLSVAYGIVAEHAGRLWVENHPGGGAAFHLRLPFGGPKPAPTASPAEPPARPLRVLVVDDEERVASVLGNLLRTLGHTPTLALGSREALDRAAVDVFDVVMVDYSMPEMDGHAFWRQLVAQGSPLARRTVFMSGNPHAAELAAATTASGALTLAKPFTTQELAAVLRVVVSR
jgi:two-component system, NtrC family, sensor kinase